MAPSFITHGVQPDRQPARPRQRRFLALLLCGALAGFGAGGVALAAPIGSPSPSSEEPAPQPPARTTPATGPAGAPAGERTFKDVQKEVEENGSKLGEVLKGLETLFDPAKRAEIGPKALPLMKRMSDLFDEGVALQPLAKGPLGKAKLEITAMRAMLGDADASAMLRKLAVSTDAEEATSAHAWEDVVTFAKAGKDAEGQKKAIEAMTALARSNPENEMIAQGTYLMSQQAATPELAEQATKIVTDVLRGPLAERMGAEMASERKLHALENKPLTVAGATVDGKNFSTADWKGKVVMVDFWATWCGPCLHELPHVKKAYDQYHPQGLEIIGVSCDTDQEDLKNFLTANPGMSWPQLFDAKAAAESAFHPLAKGYGVQVIPTMFLIDKKGVLRTVKGREQMDELIPKLLAEKAE